MAILAIIEPPSGHINCQRPVLLDCEAPEAEAFWLVTTMCDRVLAIGKCGTNPKLAIKIFLEVHTAHPETAVMDESFWKIALALKSNLLPEFIGPQG